MNPVCILPMQKRLVPTVCRFAGTSNCCLVNKTAAKCPLAGSTSFVCPFSTSKPVVEINTASSVSSSLPLTTVSSGCCQKRFFSSASSSSSGCGSHSDGKSNVGKMPVTIPSKQKETNQEHVCTAPNCIHSSHTATTAPSSASLSHKPPPCQFCKYNDSCELSWFQCLSCKKWQLRKDLNYFDVLLGENGGGTGDGSNSDSTGYQLFIDEGKLREKFINLSKAIHPDKVAAISTDNTNRQNKDNLNDRELIDSYSKWLNKAYSTLKDPLKRAKYIFKLNNVEISENEGFNSPENLELLDEIMEQLEIVHEKLGDSILTDKIFQHNQSRLEKIKSELNEIIKKATGENQFDLWAKGKELLIEWKYRQRILDAIREKSE